MTGRRTVAAVVPLAAVVLATTGAQGGCGNSTGSASATGVSTRVQEQGDPASTHKCKTVLSMPPPKAKQLVATYSVTCNFPVASASTSLVIQGRHLGADNTSWDNLGDPKVTEATGDIWITYTVPCVTGLDYQASGSIDAVGVDGTPVNTSDTTTPRSYSKPECS